MIKMIGIDHSTATLDVRGLFAVRKSEMADVMRSVKERVGAAGIVLLLTCNRMELWADCPEADAEPYFSSFDAECSKTGAGPSGAAHSGADLLRAFCENRGVDPEAYGSFFRMRCGDEAAEHLMWLASGLRSAIIAEDQILTQVKQAIDYARQEKLADNTLDVLFRTAVTAAKKIKTDAVFSRADKTAIDQAIRFLEESGDRVDGKKCLVIGNGEYGRIAADALVAAGADVTVTIRQYHSGEVLIPAGCRTIPYGEKYRIFSDMDLVVSATTSPNYTLFYDKVSECRPWHPMVLIDLAVPRDIDPAIGTLDGYTLYNIDCFRTSYDPENEQAYRKAGEIIFEKMEEFRCWKDYRDVIPLISKIRDRAADDVCRRTGKTVHSVLSGPSEREVLQERIRDASGRVVANLFYGMRDSLDEETFRRVVKAVWETT